jgi:hypothetical protein
VVNEHIPMYSDDTCEECDELIEDCVCGEEEDD